MTDLKAYATRYATQYAKESFETILVAVRRRQVVHFLEQYRPRRVLEVGCGLEPLFPHYDEFDAWSVIEPVAEFVRRARELAADDGRVEVLEGYVEDQNTPLAGDEHDFIIVSSLVHEVPDPLRLLESIRSLCSDATIVHLNVPNVLSFHRLLALEMGLIDNVFEQSAMERAFGRHTRFDHEQLATMVTSAGFCIAESGTYFVKPFSHRQMDVILASGAFPPSLVDGLERMTKYMPEHGCELYANVRRV